MRFVAIPFPRPRPLLPLPRPYAPLSTSPFPATVRRPSEPLAAGELCDGIVFEVSVDGGDAMEFLYGYLAVGGDVMCSGVKVNRLITLNCLGRRAEPKPALARLSPAI